MLVEAVSESLDSRVLKVLGSVMRSSESAFEFVDDSSVVPVLAGFLDEKDKRPELIDLIKLPKLMFEYLHLPSRAKELMEELRQSNPGFMEGDWEAAPLNWSGLSSIFSGFDDFEKIIIA